jgi:dynein heavy chain
MRPDHPQVVDKMIAKDKEVVALAEPFTMEGEVEGYLNRLTDMVTRTLKQELNNGIETAVNWEVEKPRHQWLFDYPAQIVLTGTQIYWTEETEGALEEYEGGQEDSVKRYLSLCNSRLNNLIDLVLGELTRADRTKIISLITLDVHARDVVQKLIDEKTEGPASFLWQQQLRFYWAQNTLDVDIRITDFRTKYFYEWIGNTGRLVITPLTDRCYITLTMGLRLFLGGAPAGPAGTGKTETTKDLARALALPCYVFNCSDQMNYQTMADIFRGLAQTGSWGCFDEFNRIPIEVLSVVATQVKTVQDAIVKYSVPANRDVEYMDLPAGTPPCKVGTLEFSGDTISLIPTCGFFITMNPGYAGRTELPENLKVLFRSCAMIKPDLKPICENMLMSEGFQAARTLAIKFVTLYELSENLLSKQFHYDWGLRAVKSVLRVAGMLKRGEPQLDEAQILMRALRDFNTPKIPAHDTPIFLRLIGDLFMGLEVPVKVDEALKNKCARAATESGLQADDVFLNKTVQFQELLDVRHSVMLLGPAGCAKSTIWKTLAAAHNLDKPKKTCIVETVNPKSVSGDELYGYMTLAKDWKDGVLSIIMRGMSKNFSDQGFYEYQTYKWVVLDGDIDAVWIESMNTVMDDNKVLTLVSNERVPLSDAMRMVFEINSLKNATPATVSRAGILFINESDVGWRPFVESWIQKREDQAERQHLPVLFDKYIDATSSMVRKGYKEVTPLRLLNKVCTTVYLIEGLLNSVSSDRKTPELLENMFVFSLCWAFGGPMVNDKTGDNRKKFSEEFSSAFPSSRMPKEGTCFDYYFDPIAGNFVEWSAKVDTYTPIPIGGGAGETHFSQLCVPTSDTVRLSSLMDLLVKRGRFMMLAGLAGTGKTSIIKEYLRGLDKDSDGILSHNVNMSYYTDSAALQAELELQIDKRSGRRYGPPATKRMVYFIDDMNLPYVETYGTQNAIALLTQLVAYGTIFDRTDLGFRKEIVDVQFVSAMNPTAGSFEICERLQRHFSTFCASMPSSSDLKIIFESILSGHLTEFTAPVAGACDKLVEGSISLLRMVSQKFLPSAIKFTYNWNMRELANVFQGMVCATPGEYSSPASLARLWLHECERVFRDRMLTQPEMEAFDGMVIEVAKKHFNDIPGIFERPCIFTTFAGSNTAAYTPVPNMDRLKAVLDQKLLEYNETYAMMDLVLFEQAMEHVTRICRIIQRPSGNAMLIGVGGSGKQSLSRLAAFICGYEVRQLAITGSFTVLDLKEALQEMFKTAGVKGIPLMFLMTDGQIVDDRFLIYINSILANGWISDLYAKDEIDGILGSLRNEAKSAGIPDTPEAMLEFFISRIRAFLHVVLCFSPVGDVFRVRARRFPGIINCTAIDFFHPWPRDALISVASRFLEDVDLGDNEVKSSLALHMAEEHLTVSEASKLYHEVQRRYNYVTPKSYLELIGFYKFILDQKRSEVQRQIDRLDVGLSTLRKTAADVAELQVDLKHTMVKVEEKKAATDELLVEMGVQREDAEKQQAAATIEAEKAAVASSEASKIEKEAESELAEAEPAMKAASNAVDCLSKSMLTELKSLAKPPSGVDKVTKAVLILVEKEQKNFSWDRAKKMMNNVDAFKTSLQTFRGEDITEAEIAKVAPILTDPDFSAEVMEKKSAAAANLCTWVTAIYTYNRIYVKVKPLMDSLEAARASKAAADASLEASNQCVAAVEAKLQQLQDKFMEATEEKAKVEAEAAACLNRLGLAERLVGGLSSENERWGLEIEKLRGNAVTLVGDCMLASGFVSYVGAFDQDNRDRLWKEIWTPDLVNRKIPLTPDIDPLDLLTNDGNNAKMISEGLPADRISLENGSIITNCKRWPLIIDPQTQGIKWLRKREEDNGLVVIQLTQRNWLRAVEGAITNGQTLIIENIGEEIDATLEPVLSRAIYKKGRALYLRLGGEEVEYDPGFQLYLQTKLSNPHYKPEIAAQCTLINFIATERGLEDQLLAKVVGVERPELEKQAEELQSAFQQYKIQLVQLEDELLERLANAPDDILSDVPLIEGLEATKATAKDIAAAVETGKATEIEINVARELYRKQATEGAMLYFLLTKLCAIDHMYQYSLDSFITFFLKSIGKSAPAEDVEQRVVNLRESLRLTIYTWVSRGLFERHKLILLGQLTFNLMKRGILGEENIVNEVHFQFLMRGTRKIGDENPLTWLPDAAWQGCNALAEIEEFGRFTSDLVEAAPRFREWFNHITPETEKLPLDWSALDRTPFQKMLVVRCLRPDRMITALGDFIRHALPGGASYMDCDSTLNSFQILEESYLDSTTTTPIYFILSPGANVVGDLDRLADKYGFVKNVSYHNVSMGQGQDVIAMSCLETAHRNGHWVILNNIHLMPRWLIELEKKLDEFALEGSHEKFRLYLSSDPSNSIPIGVLSRCIKLTNEPPAGLKANLKRAFANFSREYVDDADSKFKAILYGLCHFHAIMMERKLFGPMGFNMMYPFSLGDLRDSAVCLSNYMENSGGGKIPWQDLKYIFGEIMYGGHVVNSFDRIYVNQALDWYMKDELLDETEMYPFAEDEKGVSYMSPNPTTYDRYLEHIDQNMGADTPIAFGLHPNAEIDFRTTQSANLFKTIMELQPRDAAVSGDVQSPEQMVAALSDSILERFGEKKFDVEEVGRCLEEAGPYQNVFMQEMAVMNTLLEEIVRSLQELQLGFAGELTMSDSMEGLMDALYLDKIPGTWMKRAWPSLRPLTSWLGDFSLRLQQLEEWQGNPMDIPRVTWLSGLVNPQSFLTAICQVTAQKNSLELDKLVTSTEVTKKMTTDEVEAHSKDGAYIIGASMQGARWDMTGNSIEKSNPKEMFCPMPVINVKGISADRSEAQGIYTCPTYKTEQRGPTYVFSAQLKTKSTPARWILAGVALLLDVA